MNEERKEYVEILSEGNINEIKAEMGKLSDDELSYLLELEKGKEKPREGVLKLLEKAEEEIPVGDVLDRRKPWGMIHYKGVKEAYQNNKVYNHATGELIADLNEKK